MSEPKLISPMLNDFIMGDPISDHNGVRCCPAMKKDTDEKFIVKIISIPASQTQLDALLLTGACADEASALSYFKDLADDVVNEVDILDRLAALEGFLPYTDHQIVPMEDQTGYDVYLLGPYKPTLIRNFARTPMTHLSAVNLGIDLCAALSVCRRSGYLYIDLKPDNVFVTDEQEFRIGDIGFIRLDSLKYASLPDKYRSAYTAPEVKDAYSTLNTTMDIYAAGMILYQAYNNGELPAIDEAEPSGTLPAPLYADYEIAEIILKACAPAPEDRWQDPAQMGQALVSYMQRNGVNNTPIVPALASMEDDWTDCDDMTELDLAAEEDASETADAVTAGDAVTSEAPESDATLYYEDSFGNLTFLEGASSEEAATEQVETDIDYNEVTEEVSQILFHADELAAHPVPDPAVAPEPVDIPIPEPIVPEASGETVPAEADAQISQPTDPVDSTEQEASEYFDEEDPEDTEEVTPVSKKRFSPWFYACLLVLAVLILLSAGFYYYVNYYLQPIDSILVDGSRDGLIVYVSSPIDDSKLTVVCSDAYGNQIPAPVTDGKAVFTNLVPNTGYSIYVQIEGFHKLTGQTTAAYSTPVQTSIVQFSAVTGSEDGSVILGFTVDGQDADQWKVIYSAEGEPERSASFPSHIVTLTGLTIGKEYTFKLVPDTDLYVTGTDEIQFTASKLIYADDLHVSSCVDHKLTVNWAMPTDAYVENWTVSCYNSNGYSETVITADTTAVFENLDHTQAFTIEVIAGGMSVSERVYVPENSVTVTDIQADITDNFELSLRWSTSQPVPAEGWLLQYQIVDTDIKSTIVCKENSALIVPAIPGCTYTFTPQTSSGVSLLGETLTFTVPKAPDFSETFGGLSVSSDDLQFSMCKTPDAADWDRNDLKQADYTTTFAANEKASFLVKMNTSYGTEDAQIDVLYIIFNDRGAPVLTGSQSCNWSNMWHKYYCTLNVPELPTSAGQYTVCVYFNGALAAEQDFTVTA